MAVQEDLFEGTPFTSSLLITVGVAVLAPVVFPALATAARPALRGAMKLGLKLYERGNEAVAEATEVMEDLIAEARSEMAPGPASDGH